jgi:hypothetical protein
MLQPDWRGDVEIQCEPQPYAVTSYALVPDTRTVRHSQAAYTPGTAHVHGAQPTHTVTATAVPAHPA